MVPVLFFFYEGLNGDLRNLFHGTQKIDLQIVTAVCIQNKIPELVDKLEIGSVKSFYQKMQNLCSHLLGHVLDLTLLWLAP